MRMDDDDDIAATVAAGRRAAAGGPSLANQGNNSDVEDSELQSSMYTELKRKYDEAMILHREQDKTINF